MAKGLKVMRPLMHPITDKSGSQMFDAHFRTVIFALKDHTPSYICYSYPLFR
jgi:hypothetical protein